MARGTLRQSCVGDLYRQVLLSASATAHFGPRAFLLGALSTVNELGVMFFWVGLSLSCFAASVVARSVWRLLDYLS